MPEFGQSLAGGGIAKTYGAVGASSSGTTLTSGAANTKGSWVELTSATDFDANWVHVSFSRGAGIYMVDLGIGAATEQVIIPDMQARPRPTNGDASPYLFPVFIPKGSRLTARCMDASGGLTVDVAITLIGGNLAAGGTGPSYVSHYGDTSTSRGTNVDPGGSANTDSAWVEMTSATDRDHNWLVVHALCGDFAVSAGTTWQVDIGIGAATEVEILSDLTYSADALSDMTFQGVRAFPLFIPKGSRLTARLRSNSATAGDREAYINLYGAG